MLEDVFTPIIVITFYVNLTVSIYAHTLQPLNLIVKNHPRILFPSILGQLLTTT